VLLSWKVEFIFSHFTSLLEICVLKAEVFDNVRDQIGCCGIWCGSCVVGNGALKELSKRYESVVGKYGLEQWASKDFDFKEFKKGLTSIQAVSSCPGCIKGCGKIGYEIRGCALRKKMKDCCRCGEFMVCKNSEELKKMREGARGANLLVMDRNVDREEFLEKETSELRKRFPSCIQFCDTS